jgi:hypothetical protein
MTLDGTNILLDVHTPEGEGPWPVIVNFHGLSSGLKDDGATTVVAEEAASQGLLVYSPTWLVPPLDFNVETYRVWKEIANCAVAFAQQHAAANGGDPSKTVLHGFSAGIGPSHFASLQQRSSPIEGCATDAPPLPVSGVVFGDGEYFLHSMNFDGAFAADPEEMQDEVAKLVDPDEWLLDLGTRFFLWVPSSNETAQRTINDPADESSWLALRDPDGSIRADLEALGQLEDGIVSNTDAAELLARRLESAGFEVTLDRYPGGHNTSNKVDELVGYFKTAIG